MLDECAVSDYNISDRKMFLKIRGKAPFYYISLHLTDSNEGDKILPLIISDFTEINKS